MKNISREDFIMWDNLKDEPIENFDTVYHFTSIVELVNTGGVVLMEGQELRCVTELSKKWQKVISDAIEKTK